MKRRDSSPSYGRSAKRRPDPKPEEERLEGRQGTSETGSSSIQEGAHREDRSGREGGRWDGRGDEISGRGRRDDNRRGDGKRESNLRAAAGPAHRYAQSSSGYETDLSRSQPSPAPRIPQVGVGVGGGRSQEHRGEGQRVEAERPYQGARGLPAASGRERQRGDAISGIQTVGEVEARRTPVSREQAVIHSERERSQVPPPQLGEGRGGAAWGRGRGSFVIPSRLVPDGAGKSSSKESGRREERHETAGPSSSYRHGSTRGNETVFSKSQLAPFAPTTVPQVEGRAGNSQQNLGGEGQRVEKTAGERLLSLLTSSRKEEKEGRNEQEGVGRGRGGGRGRGRRAEWIPRQQFLEKEYDIVHSRAKTADGRQFIKHSQLNEKSVVKPIGLVANYFKVTHVPNWTLYHYHVDFSAEAEDFDTWLKRRLFQRINVKLGPNIFTGESLFIANPIQPEHLQVTSTRDNGEEITLTMRLVAKLAPTDPNYVSLFNSLLRKSMRKMGLTEIGRHFYDCETSIRFGSNRVQIFPGYETSMRQHEHGILLGVEIAHKVVRMETCLQVMKERRNDYNEYDKEKIRRELLGSVIITHYNMKTYRIDDIDWDRNPRSTFECKGMETSFLEFYKKRYNLEIKDVRQPLLVSRPTKTDMSRGPPQKVLLIPELCQRTGLSDEMRVNNRLMKDLAQHLLTDPDRRAVKLKDFMAKLQNTRAVQEEFNRWGLTIDNQLVKLEGLHFPQEHIHFGNNKIMPNERNDWSHAFKGIAGTRTTMFSSVPLKKWVVITPGKAAWCVDKLVNSMKRVAEPLQFFIADPLTTYRMSGSGDQPSDYSKAVDFVMNHYKRDLQLLFIILPTQVPEIYVAAKKRASLEFGVPTQCFVATNAQKDQGFMSICTKLVIQMNAKLGGVPWKMGIAPKELMVIGFDIHHSAKRTGPSVAAMVATTNETCGKCFSTASFIESRSNISEKVGADFTKCLHAYKQVNNKLPDKIIMYRCGVSEGQLSYVYEVEVKQIQKIILDVYTREAREGTPGRLIFIVVNKKINTRLFELDVSKRRQVNPPPGTVADDVITFPERYDFYLISQYTNRGTVSPVNYNVLVDNIKVSPLNLQRLTYQLCHLYFNWSGTVTVPAPCQNAKRYAYFVGTALGEEAHARLSHLPHYL